MIEAIFYLNEYFIPNSNIIIRVVTHISGVRRGKGGSPERKKKEKEKGRKRMKRVKIKKKEGKERKKEKREEKKRIK